MSDQGELITVVAEKINDSNWGKCRTCSSGYPRYTDDGGQCHDCKGMKTFLKPVMDVLTRIEVLLTKLVLATEVKSE